jgi:integrase
MPWRPRFVGVAPLELVGAAGDPVADVDAEAFDAEVKRRKRLGELAVMDAGRERLDDYVTGTWVRSHAAHLAPRQNYASSYDRHISPRLGYVPLREIDAETIAAFQGELVRSGVGSHAIRKAMTLLGAILQRAAEGRRIPYKPQRVVRKVRVPLGTEVRPLAPIRVEAMRAAAELRDATIVSVLAYSGLRPGELRELRWRHVRERTLLVNAAKTGRRRTVRLPQCARRGPGRVARGE